MLFLTVFVFLFRISVEIRETHIFVQFEVKAGAETGVCKWGAFSPVFVHSCLKLQLNDRIQGVPPKIFTLVSIPWWQLKIESEHENSINSETGVTKANEERILYGCHPSFRLGFGPGKNAFIYDLRSQITKVLTFLTND